MSTSKYKSVKLTILAAVVAAVPILVGPSEAAAQSAESLVGTYRYVKNLDHGRERIHSAFEKSIGTITPILRPLVRSRIFRNELMVGAFSISETPSLLVFQAMSPRSWTWSQPLGVPRQVTTPNGSKAQMVHRVRGNRYIQSFSSRSVNQTVTFQLSPDGNLMRVDTNVGIEIAGEPARFTRFYRRDS